MTALGLLHTGHSAEDDFPRIEQLLGSDVRVDLVRVEPDPHAADPAGRLGAPDALARATEQLRLSGAEAVVWVSTGGSFAYGWEGAQAQVSALARTAGLPASSTSVAFAHAVRELDVRRVAVAAPYQPEETARFADFLTAGGVRVVVTHAAGAPPATAWDEAELLALVRAADHADAQAVLVPDTALSTAAHIPALEKHLGKPVLTANQVTVWQALRLTDRRVNAPALGALFTREPVVQV
ncbi:decarboxylase [Streptomyces longwoodensis]|uniref:Decarboxylase n=1 Tax=Streptomyces longwoodensis TaxID=68231 RepID=A0A124HQW9_9ACTN|nr:decarboxylase [Streptomyces longwoodensis]KUN36654.1 decarboxylase [Streptomyces longwoodensis]